MKTININDNHKIPTSTMMDKLRKNFMVYSYWDNEELDKKFPAPKESTTRQFALENEASAMKGRSWYDMVDIRESMMTFREYILFFEAYHEETGKYPDEKGWTLFKDSLSGGRVASGYWRPGGRQVWFSWDDPGNRLSPGGARVALQLNAHTPISLNPRMPLSLVIAIKICKENGFEVYKKM
jgi:hypothetical protein